MSIKGFGIAIIAIWAILMAGTALAAVQVNETMGPFNVSFSMPYDVLINKTFVSHGETYSGIEFTLYALGILNRTNYQLIGMVMIFNYSRVINTTVTLDQMPSDLASIGLVGFDYYYPRTIDNQSGAVAVDRTARGFAWEYHPTKYSYAAGIIGLPWDEGALQLLKTLHISSRQDLRG